MGHGKAISGPATTPTTVKDWRRLAGRLEERAKHLKRGRGAMPVGDLADVYSPASMAEHNARIIRNATRGLPDDRPLQLSLTSQSNH